MSYLPITNEPLLVAKPTLETILSEALDLANQAHGKLAAALAVISEDESDDITEYRIYDQMLRDCGALAWHINQRRDDLRKEQAREGASN